MNLGFTLKVTAVSLNWFVYRAVLIWLPRGYLTEVSFRTCEDLAPKFVPECWRIKGAAGYTNKITKCFNWDAPWDCCATIRASRKCRGISTFSLVGKCVTDTIIKCDLVFTEVNRDAKSCPCSQLAISTVTDGRAGGLPFGWITNCTTEATTTMRFQCRLPRLKTLIVWK